MEILEAPAVPQSPGASSLAPRRLAESNEPAEDGARIKLRSLCTSRKVSEAKHGAEVRVGIEASTHPGITWKDATRHVHYTYTILWQI